MRLSGGHKTLHLVQIMAHIRGTHLMGKNSFRRVISTYKGHVQSFLYPTSNSNITIADTRDIRCMQVELVEAQLPTLA